MYPNQLGAMSGGASCFNLCADPAASIQTDLMESADRPTRKYGYLIGSDMNEKLVLGVHQQPIHVTGGTDIHELRASDAADYDLLHIPKNYFRQRVRYRLETFPLLLNCVTDPDRNPRVLANIAKMLKGYGGRVINRPEAVQRSTRDRVASALAGIDGLVVPATLRIAPRAAGSVTGLYERGLLKLPAIVRAAGSHGGEILGLCSTIAEVERAIIASPTDAIVTEYVDFRSPDNIFRKFRVFVIGDRLVFRHMVFSETWSAHVRDRMRLLAKYPEMAAEWRDWCEQGLTALGENAVATLHRIRERIELDYFGIDFGRLQDGRLVLFEANATMNFFPFPSSEQYPFSMLPLAPAQAAFRALLEADCDQALATRTLTARNHSRG